MTRLAVVPSLIETTDHVEPQRAFDFWRSTALAPFGDVRRAHTRSPFRAKRLAVATPDWLMLHTVSSPVGLEIGTRHLDSNAPEMVVVALAIDGVGYHEQHGRGARIAAGDISFMIRNRPFIAGVQSDYEEIRLALPRETFEGWIGSADAFAGRCIADRPANAAFENGFRTFAASVAFMSTSEAQIAVEGVLHLLRNLVGNPVERSDVEVSREAVASLARAYIQRRLHDPNLSPQEICTALGLSRAHLYRSFSETDGVAAAIREARLTLAYRSLASSRHDGQKVATIAYACGFTDVPNFNRAFRRRFGLSPREVRAGR